MQAEFGRFKTVTRKKVDGAVSGIWDIRHSGHRNVVIVCPDCNLRKGKLSYKKTDRTGCCIVRQ
jgi:hypothetical protein